MSKILGTNIHILSDEKLGGVLREYIEVDRKAKDGDYVSTRFGIHIVSGYNHSEIVAVDLDGYYSRVFKHGDYKTLEPTNIIRLREGRYRLVDRKAKVGEKVIIVETHPSLVYTELGEIVEIIETDGDTCGGMLKPHDIGEKGAVYRFQYRVLEPVEPAQANPELVTAEEGDDKSVLDLLANLAHRLTTLEQQVTRRVTELERKLGEYTRKIDGIEADIQNINIDLGTVEANVEMALDDIVSLDERTQPLVSKKSPVKVVVEEIHQEFNGVFTETKITAYVKGENFRLNGTFEFKGGVKNIDDAAEKVSGVFK
jgi:hypothetical protein